MHVAADDPAIGELGRPDTLTADAADVEILQRALSGPLQAQGAVEGVGAEPARFQRGRGGLECQPANRDVLSRLLSVPGDAKDPLQLRSDHLSLRHVLVR